LPKTLCELYSLNQWSDKKDEPTHNLSEADFSIKVMRAFSLD
jgi:hypothetical protein